MRVEIERTADGEAFFRIPVEYLADLKWKDGDVIHWIDNKEVAGLYESPLEKVLRISLAPALVRVSKALCPQATLCIWTFLA